MLVVSCILIKLGKINEGGGKTSVHVLGIENLVRTDAKLYLITVSSLGLKVEKIFLTMFCLLPENIRPGDFLSSV